MTVRRVALLTAGGIAPCLSAAVGGLIERYSQLAPEVDVIAYRYGYVGLLTGDSVTVTPQARAGAQVLQRFGGSPIGNSRVKLTNVRDLVGRGLVREGADPLQVAAEQLESDRVDVLHTIGGDDTNTTAAELTAYLKRNGYDLTVVGLPKTIDNYVFPVEQSLGAWTAAEQGARFARNVIAEHSSNPRMLVVHEVMGRHCGWLTAATARDYRRWLDTLDFVPSIGLDRQRWEVHGVYLPEMDVDLAAEGERLRIRMDDTGCVNLFLSEGAGIDTIVAETERRGEVVERDAFGHVRIDTLNPGAWYARQFAERIGAEKVMVQKSGYFSRSAAPNDADLRLIKECADFATRCGLGGVSGVVGHDTERGGELRAIEFDRIKGGRSFDITASWFADLLQAIGQPSGAAR